MRDHSMARFEYLMFQRGLTLVELLISIAIAMFIVLAGTALLVSAKSSYVAQVENVRIQETGRFALEVIARVTRQAAYANWDLTEGAVASADETGAAIIGMDAKSLKSRSPGITSPLGKSVNGSDVLAVRYFGAGEGRNGDGSILNCAGFGVGAPSGTRATSSDRDWSIFYVAEDGSGEPELYCKYLGNESWASQSIARGVESFQVLYGLDIDTDGIPNRFVNATELDALNNAEVNVDSAGIGHTSNPTRTSPWEKVVAVKIALLIRGSHAISGNRSPLEFDLFGEGYSNANAASDIGVKIREVDMPNEIRKRERKVFTSIVQLRRRTKGERQ